MKIIIFGAQGSGKGTQANLLSARFGLAHIDTGAMLRDEVKKGTKFGLKIKNHMEKGGFVPDGTVSKLIERRLSSPDCKNGFVLDGFPRSLEQVKELKRMSFIDFVVELRIDDKIAMYRLSNRRQCTKCGLIYGLAIKSKKTGVCDSCGGKLVKRADDTPAAIKKRLSLYHKETEPLMRFYKKKNIVKFVDAAQTVEKVFDAIVMLLHK